MSRGDDARIADTLTAIADIRADTDGMGYETFAASPATVRSVLYSIGVIGEAARHLSMAFKDQTPEVPWRAVSGIRDRIIHEYFRTNTRRIWDVVTDDLDVLENAVRLRRHSE